MTRGEAIRTFLLTNAGISVAVGGSRITPPPVKAKPNDQFPCITLQEIVGKELESLEGTSGQYQVRLQVNCWDRGLVGADELRALVKAKMLNYSGLAGSLTIAATNHAGDRYFYDGANILHQAICEFWLWWEDTGE